MNLKPPLDYYDECDLGAGRHFGFKCGVNTRVESLREYSDGTLTFS